jgi:putative MATE family efflux protein
MATDMAQHFTLGKLLRFVLPTVGMMIFTSTYSIVDGYLVSNWCGSAALAAVNFTYPILMIVGTVGFMLSTGGGAIVAKTLGEGDGERANRQFSFLVYASAAVGIACAAVCALAMRPVLVAMGVQGEMLDLCMVYAVVLSAGLPALILQYLFQGFFITAGVPSMGFIATVAAGVTNIVLDVALIAGAGMGILGAAVGTVAGEAVGFAVPLAFFARPNKSTLRLGPTSLDWHMLGRTCVNGSSEMVSDIALSLVALVYNVQLLSYLGEDGVAAYGVIMYVSIAFSSLLMGLVFGASPLMSFNFGAGNKPEMRSLFTRCISMVAVASLVLFACARGLASPLARLFVGYDAGLVQLTVHAMLVYSVAFLMTGFNMYASSLFTSLGNGQISAIISFVRSIVFEIGAVLLLPLVWGPDGIWWSVVVAEVAASVLSWTLVLRFAPRYGYLSIHVCGSAHAG